MMIMTGKRFGWAVLTSLVLSGSSIGAMRAADAAPPNFVVLMAEAQGWAQTSVQMDDRVPASRSRVLARPLATAAGPWRILAADFTDGADHEPGGNLPELSGLLFKVQSAVR